MTKVLISDSMDPRAAVIFRERGIQVDEITGQSPDELARIIGEYDGLAIRSSTKVTKTILEAATNLKVVGRAGIGVDNVDIPAATARGVVVMNTPFGNSITTAEHAIALMFALARQLPEADASTQAGKWEKNRFMGVELTGKTLEMSMGYSHPILIEPPAGISFVVPEPTKIDIVGIDKQLVGEIATFMHDGSSREQVGDGWCTSTQAHYSGVLGEGMLGVFVEAGYSRVGPIDIWGSMFGLSVRLPAAGLFGIGSYTAGIFFFKLGVPYVMVVVGASLVVTAIFGAILALPALRVTGPYLAMVTLAFGTIVQILINEMTFLTEGPLGIKVPKPSLFGHKLNELEYFYFVAVVMVFALIAVNRILRSHLGRAFQALRDSPAHAVMRHRFVGPRFKQREDLLVAHRRRNRGSAIHWVSRCIATRSTRLSSVLRWLDWRAVFTRIPKNIFHQTPITLS